MAIAATRRRQNLSLSPASSKDNGESSSLLPPHATQRRRRKASSSGKNTNSRIIAAAAAASVAALTLLLGVSYHYSSKETAATTAATAARLTEEDKGHAIPNILIFTHRWNLLILDLDQDAEQQLQKLDSDERNELRVLQQNVKNITALHPTAKVRFLTDDDCRTSLQSIDALSKSDRQLLVKHLEHEPRGMYKADLCRGAAVYETGGLYLDVDLGVRLNLFSVLQRDTEFATVKVHKQSKYPGNFFQAFTAATPQHPVLLRYLQLFLDHYEGRLTVQGPLGVILLKRAYDEIQKEQEQSQLKPQLDHQQQQLTHLNATTELWQEALYLPELRDTLLKDIPPPTWGTRRACKFIVGSL